MASIQRNKLSDENRAILRQRKMDAISAKYIHVWRLARLKPLNFFVDCLAFGVPILYFPARYLAKGTPQQSSVEGIWEWSAAFLAFMVCVKVFAKWQEQAELHSRLRDENTNIVTEASNLLRDGTATDETVNQFLARCDKLEGDDRELLSKIPEYERQAAYRQAMKEVAPDSTDAVCPVCHASPWRFSKGNCQLCGNTPALNTQSN